MPDIGQAPGIYIARPKVSIDGTDAPELALALQSLVVEDTWAGLSRCEATFANWGPKNGAVGFLFFDRQKLDFGKKLKIEMGAGDGAGQIFDGRVMALEGRFGRSRPPEVLVLAEDRLQDLRMNRRTRTFENVSDSDVFQQVASQHGLSADVDVSGETHRVLAQVNQSDLAFLRDRAAAVDAELWTEGTSMKVKARPRRSAGDVTLTHGQGLLELTILADLAHQCTGFTVAGWDVSSKKAVSHKASQSSLSAEVNGDLAGSSILQQAIGKREQQIVHELPFTEREAQALAEAHYKRAARRFVTGSGVAEGDARVRVGAKLQLKGLGPLFEGKYTVVRVRHMFSNTDGYRTHFEVERPGVNP